MNAIAEAEPRLKLNFSTSAEGTGTFEKENPNWSNLDPILQRPFRPAS